MLDKENAEIFGSVLISGFGVTGTSCFMAGAVCC